MEVRRPLLERGEEDLHITLPLGVLTDATVDGLKEVLTATRGPRRCSCTSGTRSSGSRRSSTSTAATGWWASSSGCSGPSAVLS